MTPFLQLRFWWNGASEASRLAMTISLLIVVAMVGYVALPTNDDAATQGVAAAAPGSGDAAAGAADGAARVATGEGATVASDNAGVGTAPVSNAPAAAGSTTAAPTAAGGKQCASAPPGTPGVTDKEITIALTLVALAGAVGNSAVGIASSDEFKRIGEAVRQDINAKGGVQCRQLVFKYYDVNPLSQDAQRAACLQVAQDRPLLVADIAGFAFPAGAYGCVPQQKIPLIASATLLRSEIQRFQPYVAAPNADAETQLRTMVLALRDRKWFDAANGFKKLGVLYDDCQPEANRIHDAALAEVGVTGDKVTTYTYSCPVTGFHPPSAVGQAVTQFRLAGVTNVIPVSTSSMNTFTDIAQSQGFKPKYGVGDYGGLISVFEGSIKPNDENFDRATAITTNLYGQATTPGLKPDAGTSRCLELVKKAGFSPDYVYGQKLGGLVCTQVWMAVAALSHARTLARTDVLPGLFNAGPVDLAYPSPQARFAPPLKYTAGDTYWPLEYERECRCWRVLDANRRPTYR